MNNEDFADYLFQASHTIDIIAALKKHTWHADQYFTYSIKEGEMLIHAIQPLDIDKVLSYKELQDTAELWMREIAEVLLGEITFKSYFIRVLYFNRSEYMLGRGYGFITHIKNRRKLGPIEAPVYTVNEKDQPYIDNYQIQLFTHAPLDVKYFMIHYYDSSSVMRYNLKQSDTLGVFRIVDNKKIDQSERVRKALIDELSFYLCEDGPYRNINIAYIDRFEGKFGKEYAYPVKAWGAPDD